MNAECAADCPYCSGDMCARFDGLDCTHDRDERHGYSEASDPKRTTITVRGVDLLDALPACAVEGCRHAGEVPMILQATAKPHWRVRVRLCSDHVIQGMASSEPT